MFSFLENETKLEIISRSFIFERSLQILYKKKFKYLVQCYPGKLKRANVRIFKEKKADLCHQNVVYIMLVTGFPFLKLFELWTFGKNDS